MTKRMKLMGRWVTITNIYKAPDGFFYGLLDYARIQFSAACFEPIEGGGG